MNPRPADATILVGVLAAVVGLLLAVIPYGVSIPVHSVLLGSTPAGPSSVNASCSPAVASIWHLSDKRQLALWAVTDNQHFGFEIKGGQQRWCADKAAHRLPIALILIVGGIVAIVVGRRVAKHGQLADSASSGRR